MRIDGASLKPIDYGLNREFKEEPSLLKTYNNDRVEISKEARDRFDRDRQEFFDYDFNKLMTIHEKSIKEIPTKEESDYYWQARRSDKDLDAYLYQSDKSEALKIMGKVQNILMKATTGQPLTKEEEDMVKEDPMLRQEMENRKARANMFKNKFS